MLTLLRFLNFQYKLFIVVKKLVLGQERHFHSIYFLPAQQVLRTQVSLTATLRQPIYEYRHWSATCDVSSYTITLQ